MSDTRTSYVVQRVLLDGGGVAALGHAGLCGFPATFNYLLFSQWVCLGAGGARSMGTHFPGFSLVISVTKTNVSMTIGYGSSLFNGSFAASINNLFSHVLISIDPTTQRIQVYINDVPAALATGGWVGSGPFDFTFGGTNWQLDASGSTAPGSGVGDFWCSNMASFLDLGIVANRRKFINADLSPVDLGATGSGPFGTQSPLFLTVRPGDSNPSHFVTNNGSGGVWTMGGATSLVFEPDIGCVMPPPPPPPPPPTQRLAMDNVIVSAETTLLPKNLVSLRWSDDRGHSWGHPVAVPMGEAGEYRTSLQWQRLGMTRDRVFELFWDVPCRVALQGAWIDVTPAQS